jgi:hypothetical protein
MTGPHSSVECTCGLLASKDWDAANKQTDAMFRRVAERVAAGAARNDAGMKPPMAEAQNDRQLLGLVAAAEKLARQLMHTMTADELGRIRGIIENWRRPPRREVVWIPIVEGPIGGLNTLGSWRSREIAMLQKGVIGCIRVELEEGKFDDE